MHGALRELPWGRRSRTACRARRLRSSRNSSSIVIHVVAIIASVVNGCSYRRLKPRQRHRIAVVIHVVPRSSSDLTAQEEERPKKAPKKKVPAHGGRKTAPKKGFGKGPQEHSTTAPGCNSGARGEVGARSGHVGVV